MSSERREIVLSHAMQAMIAVVVAAAVLYLLSDILTPVFLAFTIAYIFDPVVDRLEALRVPRPLGIVIVLGIALGGNALFLILVLPSIAGEVAEVAAELPAYAESGLTSLNGWLSVRGIQIPNSISELVASFGGELQSASGTLVQSASGIATWLLDSAASLLGSIFAALIVPVFAVYILNDFDRITAGIHNLIPRRYRKTVTAYAIEIDAVLSQFMRGQLTVMLVLTVLYGGTYAALGVRLAVPIGIAAGVLNIIPYLGSAFALGAGLLMSLISGWNPFQLVGVVIAYSVIQTLEGFVLTPRIVGKTVGLRDIWVLFALFVGGELFGFLGILLAVPVAAVAKIFIMRGVGRYRRSKLYRDE